MDSLGAKKPLGPDGQYVPWMNFGFQSFLHERLHKNLNVFEYGSGYSTVFYARRVGTVMSVEYDETWYETIQDLVPENAMILFMAADADGAYCRSIQSAGRQYEVVIIDGRDRINCIRQSLECLTANGVIVLDDSNREKYRQGIEIAVASGFKVLHFAGLKPLGNGEYRSSVFYREGNCLGL